MLDGSAVWQAWTRQHGRKYNNQQHLLFRVRDSKIVGVREYMDTMHAQAVLCTP